MLTESCVVNGAWTTLLNIDPSSVSGTAKFCRHCRPGANGVANKYLYGAPASRPPPTDDSKNTSRALARKTLNIHHSTLNHHRGRGLCGRGLAARKGPRRRVLSVRLAVGPIGEAAGPLYASSREAAPTREAAARAATDRPAVEAPEVGAAVLSAGAPAVSSSPGVMAASGDPAGESSASGELAAGPANMPSGVLSPTATASPAAREALMLPFRPLGKKPPRPVVLPKVTMDTTCWGVREYTMPFSSVGTTL
mmetsp:Transcript_9807/g.29498  ORF Transcript_9807/g.29498 Transcript_9807/m.29498 type:complete len:252 (-) Transcript_9807:865-1620(-)